MSAYRFLEDQIRPLREEELEDTRTECPLPECRKGRVSIPEETGTLYRVRWEDCPLCGGSGTVPPPVAADYRKLTRSGTYGRGKP